MRRSFRANENKFFSDLTKPLFQPLFIPLISDFDVWRKLKYLNVYYKRYITI